MLHPSYSDLMETVNSTVEAGDEPLVQSRYSIVIAAAKRARQIIAGEEPLVDGDKKKPLSLAVEELNQQQVTLLMGNEGEDALLQEDAEDFVTEDESAWDDGMTAVEAE